MRPLFLLLFMLLPASQAMTQNSCACCSDKNRQFNFWLGEWDVFNKKGVKVGENRIVSMLDSCVIQENWSGSGQTGTSYNFYNKADDTWNQTYIDNSGTVLVLKGSFRNHQMILESEKVKSTQANFFYINRITWAKDSLNNVSQKWDIIDEKGNILQVAFDGTYKRKKSGK
jgi:hypothetical protein